MVQTLPCLVTMWDMRLAEVIKSEQLYRQKFHILTSLLNQKWKDKCSKIKYGNENIILFMWEKLISWLILECSTLYSIQARFSHICIYSSIFYLGWHLFHLFWLILFLIFYIKVGIFFTWVCGRSGCWEWRDWIMVEARSTPCSCRSCRSEINLCLWLSPKQNAVKS